ncbi:hypothetical protein CBR_g41051 [Chara braunii]|uniref:Uncharacterized protein n=1 Tax=Chara braunii TaxID=69332 RepID=A0A388LUZ9_CHABU|nr:hypothetical protein CBR_g41051 [Chara braunii]|eukprot:GBG86147.1 hypothetical protein CBR_g41051 [Chara braunii]
MASGYPRQRILEATDDPAFPIPREIDEKHEDAKDAETRTYITRRGGDFDEMMGGDEDCWGPFGEVASTDDVRDERVGGSHARSSRAEAGITTPTTTRPQSSIPPPPAPSSAPTPAPSSAPPPASSPSPPPAQSPVPSPPSSSPPAPVPCPLPHTTTSPAPPLAPSPAPLPTPGPVSPSPVSPLQTPATEVETQKLASSLPQHGLLHRSTAIRRLRLRSPSPGVLQEEVGHRATSTDMGGPAVPEVEVTAAPAVEAEVAIAEEVRAVATREEEVRAGVAMAGQGQDGGTGDSRAVVHDTASGQVVLFSGLQLAEARQSQPTEVVVHDVPPVVFTDLKSEPLVVRPRPRRPAPQEVHCPLDAEELAAGAVLDVTRLDWQIFDQKLTHPQWQTIPFVPWAPASPVWFGSTSIGGRSRVNVLRADGGMQERASGCKPLRGCDGGVSTETLDDALKAATRVVHDQTPDKRGVPRPRLMPAHGGAALGESSGAEGLGMPRGFRRQQAVAQASARVVVLRTGGDPVTIEEDDPEMTPVAREDDEDYEGEEGGEEESESGDGDAADDDEDESPPPPSTRASRRVAHTSSSTRGKRRRASGSRGGTSRREIGRMEG